MLILGIETATNYGSIALCQDEELLLEVSLKANKGGGEFLLPVFESLLQKVGKKVNEIELIFAGTGPGSYTGIKVGLAVVKGLSEGLNIPVFGINTLRIIAENVKYYAEKVIVAIEARRDEVYASYYEIKSDILEEVEAPRVISVEKLAEKHAGSSDIILCGNVSKIYADIWTRYPNIKIGPAEWDRPSAARLAFLGMNIWRSQQTDEYKLQPSYLRKVEAELRWEEKNSENQCRTNENRGS